MQIAQHRLKLLIVAHSFTRLCSEIVEPVHQRFNTRRPLGRCGWGEHVRAIAHEDARMRSDAPRA